MSRSRAARLRAVAVDEGGYEGVELVLHMKVWVAEVQREVASCGGLAGEAQRIRRKHGGKCPNVFLAVVAAQGHDVFYSKIEDVGGAKLLCSGRRLRHEHSPFVWTGGNLLPQTLSAALSRALSVAPCGCRSNLSSQALSPLLRRLSSDCCS